MLELKPVSLSLPYCVKWNVNSTINDFCHLYNDGVKISNTLYRVGGIGGFHPKGDYSMLLKYVESFYEDNITKIKKDKPHLEGQWCILDKNGIEKVNFKSFKSPYLSGGMIYCIDNEYYNIETGEFYCKSYKSMSSSEFLFLDNAYDEDKSKRGIMKINKMDGSFELFK